MEYIEILSVPLLRDSHQLPPAIACAARLHGNGAMDAVELRFHKGEDKIRCYLGIPASLRLSQAERILANDGYLGCRAVPPGVDCASYILLRRMNENLQGTSIQMRLAAIETEAHRRLALFHALGSCEAGTGISLFIRPEGVAAALTAAASAHPALKELMDATLLYKIVLCSYGPDAALLADEAVYAFGGLQKAPIKPVRVCAEKLFSLAESNPMAYRQSILSCAAAYFLPHEAAQLTSMTLVASPAIPNGLGYNPDTIPGAPEPYPFENRGLLVGYDAKKMPLHIPLSRLKHNTCLVAPVGTGKGNWLFSLIMQLRKERIPTLVLEASKQEYHYLQRIFPDMQTWRPEGGGFLWNPFELPAGMTLSQYRPSLHQMMRTAFAMPSPLDDYFNTTMEQCYARYGYQENSRQGDPGTVPWGMHEFFIEFKKYLSTSGYSEKTKNDMSQAGLGRLQAPLNENAELYDTTHSVPIDLLTRGLNLLQLNDLSSVSAKQMFATMVLVALSAYLKTQLTHSAPDDKPRLVIILEESHQLLRATKDKSGDVGSFAEDFLSLMLTLRSVGCCFVLSTQSANLLPSEFINSCGNRIFLGDALCQGTLPPGMVKLDGDALAHLYLLKPGQGLFTTRGLSRPRFFQTSNIIDKILLTTPLLPQNHWLQDHQTQMTQVFADCSHCPGRGSCTLACRQEARQKALQLLVRYGSALGSAFAVKESQAKDDAVKRVYSRILTELAPLSDTTRQCTEVQFLRLFNRRGGCLLPVDKTQLNMEKTLQNMNKGAAEDGDGAQC